MGAHRQPGATVYREEADQLHAARVQRCRAQQGPTTDEVGLLGSHIAVHADIARQGGAVGVATHMQEALLDAQDHQRLQAIGRDAQ